MMHPPIEVARLQAVADERRARGTEVNREIVPLDWRALVRDGVPEIEYLDAARYIRRGARTWFWGPTGTSKSIYALWMAARLVERGHRVAYFSEENPLAEDLRRLALLQPGDGLAFFHRVGMDLTEEGWIAAMLATTESFDVVIFDSWTDLWSGNESDNREIASFDKQVLKPMQAQGATPIVIHHTGHPQMFTIRKGATAGRGASSLGQKADVTLDFRCEVDGAFTITDGKPRIGGASQPDRTFRVTDTDDGGIDVVEVASPKDRAVEDLAEKMVLAIGSAPRGYLTNGELRAAVGGRSERQREAMDLLVTDERVIGTTERVTAADGRARDAKVWRPARTVQGLF